MSAEFEEGQLKHVVDHFSLCSEWSRERNHFFEWLCAAEFHWFFVQGLDAIKSDFYLPGVPALLNGIEASLRITISQASANQMVAPELSPYKVLSNNLIAQAKNIGVPVEALAFPNEVSFFEKLESAKPNKIDVEVVRLRNNICHGNIYEFVNRELGTENSFFTPECLRELSESLLEISYHWAEELGKFRRADGMFNHDHF